MRVRVIHWKPEEAGPLVEACRAAGFTVDYDPVAVMEQMRGIRQNIPGALVIDLSRLPSHGREVACYVRGTKYGRQIPLVFVGGEADKVEAIRRLLPDAAYTTLKGVARAIVKAGKPRAADAGH